MMTQSEKSIAANDALKKLTEPNETNSKGELIYNG